MFVFVFFFCRPTDALFSSEPGGGQGTLSTHTVAQDCMFCLLSFVMHVILFLSAMRFGLGTSPPRGTVGCAIFPFCVRYRPLSSPPRHDGSLREGFDFGFPCLRTFALLEIAFLRLASLRHADDTREGGWSCHSALFALPLPPHWRYAAGFDGWFAFS